MGKRDRQRWLYFFSISPLIINPNGLVFSRARHIYYLPTSGCYGIHSLSVLSLGVRLRLGRKPTFFLYQLRKSAIDPTQLAINICVFLRQLLNNFTLILPRIPLQLN